LIVLLTNRKRWALHDFIARTVVVHTLSAVLQEKPARDSAVPAIP